LFPADVCFSVFPISFEAGFLNFRTAFAIQTNFLLNFVLEIFFRNPFRNCILNRFRKVCNLYSFTILFDVFWKYCTNFIFFLFVDLHKLSFRL